MTKEQLKAKKEILIKKWDESFEKLEQAKSVLDEARETTNSIKYADSAHIIISKLSTLADDNGIDESEQDYHLNKIREQMQELQKIGIMIWRVLFWFIAILIWWIIPKEKLVLIIGKNVKH